MRPLQYTIPAGFLLAFAAASPALAQAPNFPYVEIETTSVNVGVGGQSGDGILRLPNLGTNCTYPLKVSGFGAGIQLGISKASASGGVANMTRVSDLSGDYTAAEGQVTILAGGGGTSMKNNRNNVTLQLKSNTQGLNIGFGGQGMSIRVAEPPVNAPRTYVLEYGYNKDWVGQEGRPVLDRVVRGWKCRYAKIWLFGHTDTTGREDANLDLSGKRAAAARDYLVGAGVNPERIGIVAQGENHPLVATAQRRAASLEPRRRRADPGISPDTEGSEPAQRSWCVDGGLGKVNLFGPPGFKWSMRGRSSPTHFGFGLGMKPKLRRAFSPLEAACKSPTASRNAPATRTRSDLTFRATITLAVMAFVSALAACLILIQIVSFRIGDPRGGVRFRWTQPVRTPSIA